MTAADDTVGASTPTPLSGDASSPFDEANANASINASTNVEIAHPPPQSQSLPEQLPPQPPAAMYEHRPLPPLPPPPQRPARPVNELDAHLAAANFHPPPPQAKTQTPPPAPKAPERGPSSMAWFSLAGESVGAGMNMWGGSPPSSSPRPARAPPSPSRSPLSLSPSPGPIPAAVMSPAVMVPAPTVPAATVPARDGDGVDTSTSLHPHDHERDPYLLQLSAPQPSSKVFQLTGVAGLGHGRGNDRDEDSGPSPLSSPKINRSRHKVKQLMGADLSTSESGCHARPEFDDKRGNAQRVNRRPESERAAPEMGSQQHLPGQRVLSMPQPAKRRLTVSEKDRPQVLVPQRSSAHEPMLQSVQPVQSTVGGVIGIGIEHGLAAATSANAQGAQSAQSSQRSPSHASHAPPGHIRHITTPPSGSVSSFGPRVSFPASHWEGTTAATTAPSDTVISTLQPPPPPPPPPPSSPSPLKHDDPPSSPSITSSVYSEDDDDDDDDDTDPIVGSPTRHIFHDAPDHFSDNNTNDANGEIDTFVRDLDRYSVAYLDTIGFVEDEDGQISRDERENGLDSDHQWPVQVFPLRIKGTPTPRLSDSGTGGGGGTTPSASESTPAPALAPAPAPSLAPAPNMFSPDFHVQRPVVALSSLHGSSFHSSPPSSTRNSAASYSIPRGSAESGRHAPSSTLSASSPTLPEIKHVSPFDPRLPPDYRDDYRDDPRYSGGGYFDDYDSDNDEYYGFSDVEGEGGDDGEFMDLYHASAKQTAKEDAAERASREAAAAAAADALRKKKPKRGLKRLRLPSRKNTNPEKDVQKQQQQQHHHSHHSHHHQKPPTPTTTTPTSQTAESPIVREPVSAFDWDSDGEGDNDETESGYLTRMLRWPSALQHSDSPGPGSGSVSSREGGRGRNLMSSLKAAGGLSKKKDKKADGRIHAIPE